MKNTDKLNLSIDFQTFKELLILCDNRDERLFDVLEPILVQKLNRAAARERWQKQLSKKREP